MSKLTVIILAKNEEQNIVDCINSAKFADEVLIIDDFSTDKTVQIAESMGARVVQHALENNRNRGYHLWTYVTGKSESFTMIASDNEN